MAAEDAAGKLLVGECKWTRRPIGRDSLATFQARVTGRPALAERRPQLVFFAGAGFRPDALRFAVQPHMEPVTLPDLFPD